MSGPPYPRYGSGAAPGGNAIGSFVIGESPIGTIQAFDVWSTVLMQYANKFTITSLITSFDAAMDLTEDFDQFYDTIFNVLTAAGNGLDIWGRIVGAPRTFAVGGSTPPTFGFQEPGNDWVGFGQAPFSSGVSPTTNVTLLDPQYRSVVLAKAATNIWDGTIPGFNAILLALFKGRGAPYVVDNGNMSITLTFQVALTPLDIAIINGGILPQPTGVIVNTSYP
jgi:hypothetical protein